MPLNRFYAIWILFVVCSSCIDPYEPVLDESQEVLVISGMISDIPGRQTVTVSRSSPYSEPGFQPVENCLVSVSDQEGNMIHYADEGQGIYAAQVAGEFLEPGDAVSLYVVTPDGNEYRSDYDTLLPCPNINNLYYEVRYLETSDPGKSLPGIQFYLDLSGEPADSRDLIWRIDETWEYWASLFGNYIWWGEGWFEEFLSNPLYKCWMNVPLDHFFLGSTRNLSSNEMQKVALNFVSNETDRLQITYSLLVQQQSLSREAFDYWKRMNDQAVETGGLYEKQPASVPGNVYNVNDPDETVLGFFYASQVQERRIFVHNNGFFEFRIQHLECEYQPLIALWDRDKIEFPVYIYQEGPFKPYYTGDAECFDCRLRGGTTIRPQFWESWE